MSSSATKPDHGLQIASGWTPDAEELPKLEFCFADSGLRLDSISNAAIFKMLFTTDTVITIRLAGGSVTVACVSGEGFELKASQKKMTFLSTGDEKAMLRATVKLGYTTVTHAREMSFECPDDRFVINSTGPTASRFEDD